MLRFERRLGENVHKPHRRSRSRLDLTKQTAIRALHRPGNTDRSRHDMPPTINPTERQLVFTSSQAALYLGVSLATIRRWTDAGHIACYRTPGGQRRFSRAQLDGFITSMSQNGPVAAAETRQRPAARVA
jgi:excisionase family DNA binding protein